MIRVWSYTNGEKSYLISRDKHVRECITKNKWIDVRNNDYFTLIRNLKNECHQLFEYKDEYGYQRYYTVNTYLTSTSQAYAFGPYESLAYHSDINGNPLCENADPFNNGTVNNTGTSLEETHYATIFDLRYACHYFWEKNESDEDDVF